MRSLEVMLSKVSRVFPDCSAMASKLRAMTYNAEEEVRAQKNQATYLVKIAGRTTPKGLHCLSMRLTAGYFALPAEERQLPNQQRVQDPDLYHYAVFTGNVLSCAVVVNSTVSSAMLNKILLFDHDMVVQKDLADLGSLNMNKKVIGAVDTCREGEASFRRMDMFINFSDPFVIKRFDVKTCTWAFGMNLFDLQEWKRHNLTALYNKYLQLGHTRQLWKAGSLPLGWATFYNRTVILDRRWHKLGLGHEAGVGHDGVEQAAVLHYDGVMKPWLDIGIGKYKSYWSKHINYDHPYLQQCNIHE